MYLDAVLLLGMQTSSQLVWRRGGGEIRVTIFVPIRTRCINIKFTSCRPVHAIDQRGNIYSVSSIRTSF